MVVTLALDANVIVDLIRGDRCVRAAHLQARTRDTPMSVSVLVTQELRFGAELSPKPSAEHSLIDAWLEGKTVLPYELQDAHFAARAQATMERYGARAPYDDFLIGAHALSRGLVLVTANTRHFRNIPGLQLLDWREAPTCHQDLINA